ncbi:methyltransferase [Isoptericola sp. b490]|uniref:DUF7059 domain-containing protein n=1 Tax=Actinotalea lenta TaxID=3064654 RepID=UPI0027123206|nr:methyltransferase [Isoptericola sp. b490]MDO8121752.1 methyltransferase [Isoptericola sp. b490]
MTRDPAPLPAPPRLRAADIESLAADLAPYGAEDVEHRLGPLAAAALHREQPAAARLATRGPAQAGDALAAIVRCFVLGAETTRRALDTALPRSGSAGLERLGLIRSSGTAGQDAVRASVDLRPVDAVDHTGSTTWWVASDLGAMSTRGPLHAEHVLGVGGASVTLAGLTVRDRRARTLDLGTGCGIQALHAARHSGAVVATDVSPRALAYAAFNAALAGVELDLRAGSMLDPVRGEQFDLVVSNPPFVITPRSLTDDALPTYTYRDGGMAGDALVRALVTDVGGVLAPGGVAQLLGNWEHRTGEDWTERVGAWLDASGLDGWVVQREVLDPAEYAELWLRDGGALREQDPAAWDRTMTAWLADFAARGVDAVGLGFVVLRRPVGAVPTLRRLEEQRGAAPGPLGPHLADVLASHDLVTGLDDDTLLGLRLRTAADVTEERHLRPGASGPQAIVLRQGGGFGRTVPVDTALAGLVGACDGELTLGQLTGGLAAVLEVDLGSLRAELLGPVRQLVTDGFLQVV